MIELRTSVKSSQHYDTTRTRTPAKPGYLKLTITAASRGMHISQKR